MTLQKKNLRRPPMRDDEVVPKPRPFEGYANVHFDDGTCKHRQAFFYLEWMCFLHLNLGTESIE